jgi:CRISPR-associated protein Csd1
VLVQALAGYADAYLADQLTNEAWEDKPVPYFIAIDSGGTFLASVPRTQAAVRGKKIVSIPAPLSVPRSPVPRNAGLYPLLAADDIKYVLGVGPWTSRDQQANNQERHEAFAALVRKAAGETDDDGLKAAAAFYDRPDQVAAARAAVAEAKAGSILALALLNEPLVKRPSVRSYWSRLYATAAAGRVAKGGDAECLISGIIGSIAPTHEKIKGLASLGGQSAGVSLMSFDKDAFCSYGWDQNANSPVSPDRAMAYVLALNDLLRRDGKHRRDIAGVGFIFWTKEPAEFDPMLTIDQAQPEQVQRLLTFNPLADPDPNMFYMAGVAGNGARMLIRYWIAGTLATVKGNLKNWFDELRVADVFTGKPSEPPKFWQLLYAIEREAEPPADRVVALIRRAIEGPAQPLGYRMLGAALARLRVSSSNSLDPARNRLDPARIGLIRLCLNDQVRSRNQGGSLMKESLDTGQKHEAYLCGRLMAIYESLQYSASGEVNQTVADRYYTLASTYPSMAFPKLQDLGNKHLRKLRRDNRGAMVRIEQLIDQIHLEIEQTSGFKFPAALDLDGQGRFALGYHHQRANQMEQAQAHKKAKEEQTNSPAPRETI